MFRVGAQEHDPVSLDGGLFAFDQAQPLCIEPLSSRHVFNEDADRANANGFKRTGKQDAADVKGLGQFVLPAVAGSQVDSVRFSGGQLGCLRAGGQ